MRILFVFFIGISTFTMVKAQEPVKEKLIVPSPSKTDTTAKPYINEGKIAGKKAINRSLILPGLGQAYNYGLVVKDIRNGKIEGKGVGKKIAIIGKIAGIYVAGTMLTMSYIDNNQKYRQFLKELQYRQAHNNVPDPDGSLQNISVETLYVGKAIYKNNREVVLISLIGTYGINVIDAYVTARLKYISVDEDLAFKITPSVINSNAMYGYNSYVPALKLTLKL